MDFDDLDDVIQAPPPKQSKSVSFQPKVKQSTAKTESKVPPPPQPMKAEPPVAETAVVTKEKDSCSLSAAAAAAAKMDVDEEFSGKNADNSEVKEEEDREIPETLNVAGDFMDEDVEEDYVVAEYDVYYTPRDPATQLYVLQYPLRPLWRPYELEQRCTEVRVKPNSGEMEIDLSIDTDSDNYDQRGKMTKQTLSSSGKLPKATTYAVGVLSGKKLYLNLVHAVVQLRPSMDHLDSGESKKKYNPNLAVKEGSNNDAIVGPSRKQNKQMDPEAVESWISLKYHSSATELAERYFRKVVTEQNDPLQFLMNPYDYLNSLCPGAVVNKLTSSGPSRRSLLSLPLEERLKTLLVEGPSVQRFNTIKHLAPDDPVDDVLEILQKYAHLVQGLWVPKTRIRHPNVQGAEVLARDYALLLFSQSPVIKDSKLDILGSHKSIGKVVLRDIAVERPFCKDWKFKESTDVSFMKLYPDVVEKQMKLWQAHEPQILDKFKRKPISSSKSSFKSGPSMRSDEGAVRATSVALSASTSMSKETREALPKELKKLFHSHKVCSFQTICQGLRDIAVSMSALPKADARAAAAVAAAKGIDAPQEELRSVICEVAFNVHGVYVLKSSSEHPELDPLRKVVIDLFLGSGPNAKLKKGEFMEAAKIRLQKEPTNSEFQKVINEICVSKGGAWVLKSGDGVPK